MQAAVLTAETKHYIKCPYCGAEGKNSSINHLFTYLKQDGQECNFGPWRCSECGQRYSGKIVRQGADVQAFIELQPSHGVDVPCYDLLKYYKDEVPLFVIVESTDWGRGATEGFAAGEEPYHGKEYLYNEGTCPTNWLRGVFRVIDDGDTDPHGVFQYVGSFDIDPKVNYYSWDLAQWAEKFPQLKAAE